MGVTKWYIISEAIADGGTIERHRISALTADYKCGADPALARAETWARSYSEQTGMPTAIEVVWLGDTGEQLSAEGEGFYYDPAYPQRDPYQRYGY